MSWYTNIYPDITKFSHERFESTGAIEEEIEKLKSEREEKWGTILALVFATPNVIVSPGDDIIETLTTKFNKVWKEYRDLIDQEYYLYRVQELWEDEISHKDYIEKYPEGGGYNDLWDEEDPSRLTKEEYLAKLKKERDAWKPSCSVNHFQYNHFPQEGITECNKYITEVKQKLLSYIIAVPKDIVPEKDEEGNINDPVLYLTKDLNDLKEWLNDNIWDLNFSKLCVEYWDTHTEG